MRVSNDLVKIAALFHPIIFSIYPIISLYDSNIGNVYFRDTYRSILFAFILGLLVWWLCRVALKTWSRAGLLASPILLWFYAYGHLDILAAYWQPSMTPLGRHALLLVLSMSLFAAWAFTIQSKIRQPDRINGIFLVMSLVMIGIPAYRILFNHQPAVPTSPEAANSEISLRWENAEQDLPDIYYIILDGYSRADILQTIYDYDNSPFIAALNQRGFYVADQSHSNYGQTLLSLASSLNFDYINDPGMEAGTSSNDRSILESMVQHNRVRQLLSTLGYTFVTYETPLPGTTIRDADRFMAVTAQKDPRDLNPFEGQIATTSFLTFLRDTQLIPPQTWAQHVIEPGYEAHRNQTLHIFQHLAEASRLEGPQFVFAHIVAPHPPFIFGAEGERLSHELPFTLKDGSHNSLSQEEYLRAYQDQLVYISALILDAVDEILASYEELPIIIIQADHGSGAYLDWGSLEQTNVQERFSILNAYLLPGEDETWLYPQISPVNTFRLIFNQYFSTDLPLLPDRSFFSEWYSPYDLMEVTSQLE